MPIEALAAIPHSKPILSPEDLAAVRTVLQTGMIASGSTVDSFERAVSRYLGFAGGVAASTGTSALFAALVALGVGSGGEGSGDEVILPTYVCRSVLDAVCASGATPVLCDVGDDWCVSRETVARHLTSRTKAIIVVHTFGVAADAASIAELGPPVIEDCCQAFGAAAGSTPLGQAGRLSVVSFHATKLLTTGEGGMVLSNEASLLAGARATLAGAHAGRRPWYRQPMSDLQAALGCSQLSRYDAFLQRRLLLANRYFSALEDLPVGLPLHVRNRSLFFRFPVTVAGGFDTLQTQFQTFGVHVRRGVDGLLHRELSMKPEHFPTAERCFSTTLSLPLYPALTDDEARRVIAAARVLLAGR